MTYVLTNFGSDTLAATMAVGASTATLTAGSFGSPTGTQVLVVDQNNSKREVILCTISGTSLTSITAVGGGSTIYEHASGATVISAFTQQHYGDLGKIAAADAWTAHSATLGGFSGTPTQANAYQALGKSVLIRISISGTSNATNFTFTLPFASKVAQHITPTSAQDSGSYVTATLPTIVLTASSTTATAYKDIGGALWTGSGTKAVEAYFVYEAA